ncbi:endonuclease/exonuclease/phosphatase family protein [Cytophagaceae bacterium ABcell3]|nr:endonuclease/exonuclease/phosphatase family protein [Cytophagaceae bacterium ABcell3]
MSVVPVISLLVSYPQITETIGTSFKKTNPEEETLKVTSYNAGTFYYYRWENKQDTSTSKKSIRWIAQKIDSDILCIQEFYNNDALSAESSLEKIKNAGYSYYHTSPVKLSNYEGFFGLITFSKHPIVNGGSIEFSGKKSLNRGLYSDIKIDTDTIRVINMHLESMSIRLNPDISIHKPKTILENQKDIYKKLKKGFITREKQINKIADFAAKSPYPIIICCDLNDTPYSYTYKRLKKSYNNAFEQAGKGFGFTYNKFPWLIRIDHQFYSKKYFKPIGFKVYKDNKHSDHYPIESEYLIKER